MNNIDAIKNILLIDDDADDCYLFSDAIAHFSQHKVTTVNNFIEAISFLTVQIPDLIFLDLNMPFKNGFECLADLKRNEAFRNIPVLIFSSSSYSRDIKIAYETGAALYFTKPSTFEELILALKTILGKDWSRAASITAKYFINGTYAPFSLEAF